MVAGRYSDPLPRGADAADVVNTPSGRDSMQVQRYDFFDGGCEEVGASCRGASGAEVTMFVHDENPFDALPPGIVGPLPFWSAFHSAVYRRQ